MFRLVPPAGAPLEVSQVLRAMLTALRTNGDLEDFTALAARLKIRYAVGASSGRAALWLILRALQRLRPERKVVAIPAYTCFTVPASVVRAGLKLCPVDIDPGTLDFDFDQLNALPEEGLLCVVSSNLFGLVNDVDRIRAIAHAKGAFFVDDAAQAFGASRNGYFSGLSGDIGLFSFGRGKAVTTIEGGLAVTNSEEIFRVLQAEGRKLPGSSPYHDGLLLLKMIAYALFLNPRFYWIPDSLPFLKLGATEFAPSFPVASMPGLSRALLPQVAGTLAGINRIRRINAVAIAEALAENPKFTTPRPGPDSQPTFIRFPLIAVDEGARNRAIDRLRDAGIGASTFYPSAICDIARIDEHMCSRDFHRPQAEALARRLLTLPTHPLVRRDDLDRMIAILNDPEPA